MQRRTFVKSAAAAAAVGLHAPDHHERDYYELRVYQLKSGGGRGPLNAYLREAYMPAIGRMGGGPVGVFTEMGLSDPPKVYVLTAFRSLDQFANLHTTLASDAAYRAAGREYLERPSSQLVYTRFDASLLEAFEGMPRLERPKTGNRLFELRTYEGHNADAVRRKVLMFDREEIPLFRDVGLHPVFFGHKLAGPDMPALTYLLAFDDLAERDRNWQRFLDSPVWEAMRDKPEYADSVSNIVRTFLLPTDYSQV